ncbi:hypothetical protein [Dyella ginsengisoli]|uniref:hypothetical protein n=1 Tax=Dyella ginsengisoli TaxID=363848 RepID=UPI0003453AAA|nr:hypothetical protein [Dyella ginsengisoli]
MTFRRYRIPFVAAAALFAAGQAVAAQTGSMSSPPPGNTTATPDSAVFQTPQGQVTIRSTLPPPPSDNPPPPFTQLAGKSRFITPEQAAAYPPLANDFDYADSNRNGRISEAEYARWTKGK